MCIYTFWPLDGNLISDKNTGARLRYGNKLKVLLLTSGAFISLVKEHKTVLTNLKIQKRNAGILHLYCVGYTQFCY